MLGDEMTKDRLLKFDKEQLQSLLKYVSESEGYPVNLVNFRKRLDGFLRLLVEKNQGSLPFKLGIFKDYWHSIPPQQIPKFEKTKAFKEHHEQIDTAIVSFKEHQQDWMTSLDA
jgi:hypothetical protein